MRSVVFVSAVVVLAACTPPPPPLAYGEIEELHWIRPPDLAYLDTTIQTLFSKTYYTPHEDPLFRIVTHPSDSFLQTRKGYQQMLWATVEGTADDASFRKTLQQDQPGIVFRRNVFTNNAFLIGILETKPEALEYRLTRDASRIRDSLLSNVLKNLRRAVFYAGRNTKLENKIQRQYGVSMAIPTGYALFLEEGNAFGIAKHEPTRFLSVFRLPIPTSLTPDTLIHIRDSLAQIYYEGDRVWVERTVADTGKLGNRTVWILTGPWQNDSPLRGGAFRLYAWIDQDTLWIVDTGVYAPDREHKWPLLLRLQILAATVQPSS